MTADSSAPLAVHASVVAVDGAGVLIRGAAGAGKSTLARELIQLGVLGGRSAALVGDDRVLLSERGGRIWATPCPALAGLLEVRGIGIMRVPHLDEAPLALVVDLTAEPPPRLPEPEELEVRILAVRVPRIVVNGPGKALLTLWRLCSSHDTIVTEI